MTLETDTQTFYDSYIINSIDRNANGLRQSEHTQLASILYRIGYDRLADSPAISRGTRIAYLTDQNLFIINNPTNLQPFTNQLFEFYRFTNINFKKENKILAENIFEGPQPISEEKYKIPTEIGNLFFSASFGLALGMMFASQDSITMFPEISGAVLGALYGFSLTRSSDAGYLTQNNSAWHTLYAPGHISGLISYEREQRKQNNIRNLITSVSNNENCIFMALEPYLRL